MFGIWILTGKQLNSVGPWPYKLWLNACQGIVANKVWKSQPHWIGLSLCLVFVMDDLLVLFQWDENYFPHSNIPSTQYIPTPVHTLNTSYKIIYFNTLCIWFMSTYPFYSSTAISPCPKKLHHKTIHNI